MNRRDLLEILFKNAKKQNSFILYLKLIFKGLLK